MRGELLRSSRRTRDCLGPHRMGGALYSLSPAQLQRIEGIDAPPRGLVMTVAAAGVLLGLSDRMVDWPDCRQMLKGRLVGLSRMHLRHARMRGETVDASFWQRLERFRASDVSE